MNKRFGERKEESCPLQNDRLYPPPTNVHHTHTKGDGGASPMPQDITLDIPNYFASKTFVGRVPQWRF